MTAVAPQTPNASILETEWALLGAVMYEPSACEDTLERLRPEHWSEGIQGRIWAAILSQHRQQGACDPLTVARELGADTDLADLGGPRFLAQLVDQATLWTVPAYTEAVLDAAARRAIVRLAREIIAHADSVSAETMLADMERGALEIARDGGEKVLAEPVGLTALEMLDQARRGEFTGTPTGLDTIDHVTGGIREDDVWFIGGRTSMGKSICGMTFGRGIAQKGRGVMMFSLEMPKREVQARLTADLAWSDEARYDAFDPNIRYGEILKGRGTPRQWDRARFAAKAMAQMPFVVTDKGGLTIEDIRSQARRQMRAWDRAGVPRGAILIDHIGLVKAHTKRGDSKAAETADVVNELKALAKELKAPIIALCQVNRNTENRTDKKPTMGDLNWSGAIEQIADFVCLLYRESYYLARSSDEGDRDRAVQVEHDMELLIHKNRAGPICSLRAFTDIACNVIRDYPDDRRRA